MIAPLARAARFAIIVAAGFALSALGIIFATASGNKDGLLWTLGISSAQDNSPLLAAASCDIPDESVAEDIYFVSCGGFF